MATRRVNNSQRQAHYEYSDGKANIPNVAAPNVPFFTPAQQPSAGTAVKPQPDNKPIPKLFTPLKIRGMVMQNRIMVSPLCQYSAHEGFHTPWHVTHLGGIVQRGVSNPRINLCISEEMINLVSSDMSTIAWLNDG